MIEARGPGLREPYAKKVSKEIYELRPGFAKTEMRLLYFWEGSTAWFVSGFVKKTQKTPQAEIALAEERMKRYCAAKGGGK